MFEWLKRRHLKQIKSSGGYPEKLDAIEAKERVADAILQNANPSTHNRRFRQVAIPFAERRQFDIGMLDNIVE